MLVIARRVGESLCIGPDITVTVREVRGKQVKLTISAPPTVAVARAEIGLDVGVAPAQGAVRRPQDWEPRGPEQPDGGQP